jgi:hypothetical protein
MKKLICALFCSIFLVLALQIWPQNASVVSQLSQDESLSLIGMKLDELINRFGSPQTVHAARGEELWQDDVVFVYTDNEFYIYHDRVWQVSLKAIYNIKIGDSKAVALLVLGETAQDMGDYILFTVLSGAWPVSLRVNCNAGKVSAIYVYRTDY